MPKVCSEGGCDSIALARGLCSKHYQRLRNHGVVEGKYRRRPENRFWEWVDQSGGPEACWLWKGSPAAKYGTFIRHPKDGGRIGAHRYAYELVNGPIADGLLVMHKCDVPRCCNPDHLRVGTPKENMADMDAKGRRVIAYAKGEKSQLSVLNEHAVRFIRSTDLTTAELARIFGLTHQAVRAVRIRKSWKHVT